jgi:hypothetical protein
MRRLAIILSSVAILAAPAALAASAPPTVTLVLKDHRFSPSVIQVAAEQKVRIRLINQDAAGEEFDSRDLDIEEDVTPLGQTSFEIGPLKPGRYRFSGEFHAQTAEGEVVAAPAGR